MTSMSGGPTNPANAFEITDRDVKQRGGADHVTREGGATVAVWAVQQRIVEVRGQRVLLDGDLAVAVNVQIMRAFVLLRRSLQSNQDLAHRLDELESRYDERFRLVFDAIRQLMAPQAPSRRHPIGFAPPTDADDA
jgi:hypothetical protein